MDDFTTRTYGTSGMDNRPLFGETSARVMHLLHYQDHDFLLNISFHGKLSHCGSKIGCMLDYTEQYLEGLLHVKKKVICDFKGIHK